jgi:hypothetical protein
MGDIGVLFLVLLIPGLLVVIWVVAVAMPRAMRDEKRLREHRCVHCGGEYGTATVCPHCGRTATGSQGANGAPRTDP